MNSNARNSLVVAMAGVVAVLVGVNQYASHQQLQTLQREVGQLRRQVAQQDADYTANLRRTAALRLGPDELEARLQRQAQAARADQTFGHGVATAARSQATKHRWFSHHATPSAAASASDATGAPDQVRLSEAELDSVFAGMGVPPPGPVAAGGMIPPQGQGEAEEAASRPARHVESGGVLLRRGHLQLEPVVSYSHLSNNRVALSGFSVFDVVFVGEIRSDMVKRDIITSSLNARYGITNNLQAEFEAPMQYQRQETISGPIESPQSSTTTTSGLSDLGAGLFYQFLHEQGARPTMIAHMKVKAPTGHIPLGTGGWGLQTSLITMKTSDPVVLFSNVGFSFNFPTTVGGQQVNPGNSFQYSVGMAYALNYNLALNASFEQSFIGESAVAGTSVKGSRLVVADLKTGVTYAITKNLSLDFSVGAGLTSDSPDLSVTFSLPYTF